MWQILAGAECCLIPVWLPPSLGRDVHIHKTHGSVCVRVRVHFVLESAGEKSKTQREDTCREQRWKENESCA